MPLFMPPAKGIVAAGGGGPTSISFVNSAKGTLSLTMPTVQDNDIGIFVSRGRSNPTKVIPSGWTELTYQNSANPDYITCSKKLTNAADSGATVTGLNANNQEDCIVMVFRPDVECAAFSSADVQSEQWTSTAGNPSARTVTSSGGTAPTLMLGFGGTNGSISSFSTDPFDGTAFQREVGMGYVIMNSTPANQTFDINDLGNSNELHGYYLDFVAP